MRGPEPMARHPPHHPQWRNTHHMYTGVSSFLGSGHFITPVALFLK